MSAVKSLGNTATLGVSYSHLERICEGFRSFSTLSYPNQVFIHVLEKLSKQEEKWLQELLTESFFPIHGPVPEGLGLQPPEQRRWQEMLSHGGVAPHGGVVGALSVDPRPFPADP